MGYEGGGEASGDIATVTATAIVVVVVVVVVVAVAVVFKVVGIGVLVDDYFVLIDVV